MLGGDRRRLELAYSLMLPFADFSQISIKVESVGDRLVVDIGGLTRRLHPRSWKAVASAAFETPERCSLSPIGWTSTQGGSDGFERQEDRHSGNERL
jgi:hypothetical protein